MELCRYEELLDETVMIGTARERCDRPGQVGCEYCHRSFCFEHAKDMVQSRGNLVCPDCVFDHKSNNYPKRGHTA